MSTLVLSYAGKAAGTALAGPLGGLLGGVAGAGLGGVLDRALFGSRPRPQINAGPRLSELYVTASSEGAAIARVFGRPRVAGQIIWATKLREEQHVETVKTRGGKGAPTQKTYNVTYTYSVSLAVALCEGPITAIGEIYADGKPLRLADYQARIYLGDEAQGPDPKIEAVEGGAPAYRGLAYIVVEDMPLAAFGNRVPVITAEVIRRPPCADGRPALEDLVTAVTLIPAMGEFVYATAPVTANAFGALAGQNTVSGAVDLVRALDQLQAEAPACRHVSLVVAWQGTDLRLAACRIVPKAEAARKTTDLPWSAGGLARAQAQRVSRDPDGNPLIGGAPCDLSVVQAIRELKRRGFSVTLYPFVMMDVPAGNGLPDPYGGPEQAAFPWRGRVTCDPAIGRPGSPDGTPAAADQVAAFFGRVAPADLAWSGGTVTCARAEWSFRRFILTCARLAEAAGGVDGFLIGSEMVGLTALRSGPGLFPAVAQLRALAADARAILGPGTAIGYGADWTEYASHRPQDGSGDVYFHLDPLWADPNIDFVGIDNYMPLADWRDGFGHLDARRFASVDDPAYLAGNVAGGELFDWFYPTQADRDAQNRVPIRDTAHGEDWVFRLKELRAWWANPHHDRPGGVRRATATAWVPQSKPIRFTELGCPAVDKGANQPNVFVDPKSSESLLPYFSNGRQDVAMQRAFLEAVLRHWRAPEANPVSAVYGGRMVDAERIFVWTWDARPYPDFPRQVGVWSDAPNYALGHWLNGRLTLGSLLDVVADLCRGTGVEVDVSALRGVVFGYVVAEVQAPRDSLAPLRTAFFFDGVESGGVLRFRPLARAPVARFTQADLVAAGQGPDFRRTRTEEAALPAALSLSFVDPARGYQSAAVEARRLSGRAASVSRVSLPLCLEEGAARGLAQALLYQAVVEREAVTATLPPSALALEVGDVVALDLAGSPVEVRLTRLGLEAGRPFSAVRADAGVYAYRDGGGTGRAPAPPAAVGVGLFRILDLPLLSAQAVPHAPSFAAYTVPWSPVSVLRALAGGAPEADALIQARSIIGELVADLFPGPTGRWDRVNEVFVQVPPGAELVSASDLDVLNGANTAALLGPSGAWEVLQWAGATLLGAGRYRLAGLLRGQLGTEFAMGAPTPARAAFVVLSQALVQSGMPASARGLPQDFRWGPAARGPEDPSYAAARVTVTGAGLRPYAPVQARLRRRESGDLDLSWIRRTRRDGDSWDQVEVPLAEETEAYAVDILSETGAVRRRLAAAGPSLTYPVAEQAADFGGPVRRLTVAICQVSAAYGRGIPLRITLDV
ncbi:gene transfer agent (GTA) like protein [Methylobacterium sp. 4-46]|uniref:baseplate multidomain protein megatron n=1 Tax=unclassified Methylobacterium TaxID=2615210 RepID=UPI000165CBA5|nr:MULTISPECIES: glycoside hydrolase/phage tail family protein [Methylobacterium]ACA20254.1 gene transfer agent (GTA) like protein [Methylobacterium sp. 4-46]WFT79431.1 glycoside hydrolase/phage tail family protein [Methylobacterium nodulans]